MEVIQAEKIEPNTTTPVSQLDGSWPFLGHLREFQQDPIAMLTRGYEKHGELFKFKLGFKDFVLFSGLEAHDFYFRAKETELNAKAVYRFTVPVFGDGVAYDTTPEIMSEQLGFLFPALREASMRRFADLMYDEIKQFTDELGDRGELNLPRAMNDLTVKIASRCLLGQEIRDRVDTDFADLYKDLQKGINTLGFFFPMLPTPAHYKRDKARKKVVALFSQIIAARRKNNSTAGDFLQTLMDAHYKSGDALSDDEITGILLTVLFAGQHTSAILGTWIGLELFRSPKFIERIRDEMKTVYGEETAVNFDALQNQSLIENVVREGERLHPPLILLIRKVMQTLEFKGKVIPAGTMAMISPALSHRLPQIFADPEQFNPDRFAPPHNELKQHHYTLIGFGGGKHACMGKNFAIMQLKAIWSVFLDHFDFTPLTEFPRPNYGSWVTGPVLPCTIQYKRRNKTIFK